jgi:NCAIR mutase (PurE)-related protein
MSHHYEQELKKLDTAFDQLKDKQKVDNHRKSCTQTESVTKRTVSTEAVIKVDQATVQDKTITMIPSKSLGFMEEEDEESIVLRSNTSLPVEIDKMEMIQLTTDSDLDKYMQDIYDRLEKETRVLAMRMNVQNTLTD